MIGGYDFGDIPDGLIIGATGHRPERMLNTFDLRAAMPAIEVIMGELIDIAAEEDAVREGTPQEFDKTHVICGAGPGFDQWVMAATLMLKKDDYPFELWFIIPWKGFEFSRFWQGNNAWVKKALGQAAKVNYLTDVMIRPNDRPAQMAMIHDRNKYVARFAQRGLECFDGVEDGGTWRTRSQMAQRDIKINNCFEGVMAALKAEQVKQQGIQV